MHEQAAAQTVDEIDVFRDEFQTFPRQGSIMRSASATKLESPGVCGRRTSILSSSSNPSMSNGSSSYTTSLLSSPQTPINDVSSTKATQHQHQHVTLPETPMGRPEDVSTYPSSGVDNELMFTYPMTFNSDDLPFSASFNTNYSTEAPYSGSLFNQDFAYVSGGFQNQQCNFMTARCGQQQQSWPQRSSVLTASWQPDTFMTDNLQVTPVSRVSCNLSYNTIDPAHVGGAPYEGASPQTPLHVKRQDDIEDSDMPSMISSPLAPPRASFGSACDTSYAQPGPKHSNTRARRHRKSHSARSVSRLDDDDIDSIGYPCKRIPANKKYCRYDGCDKSFSRTEHKRRHEKSCKHRCERTDRPFRCPLDDCRHNIEKGGFSRSDNKQQHMVTHYTGKRNLCLPKGFLYWIMRKRDGNQGQDVINRLERRFEDEEKKPGDIKEDILRAYAQYREWEALGRPVNV